MYTDLDSANNRLCADDAAIACYRAFVAAKTKRTLLGAEQ